MTGDKRPGIPFENWGAVNQDEAQRLARNADLAPLALRLFFAAVGWANRTGHAEFASGDLADILGSHSPCGAWRPLSRQQVSSVIARARDLGLLHPHSKARCLMLE